MTRLRALTSHGIQQSESFSRDRTRKLSTLPRIC